MICPHPRTTLHNFGVQPPLDEPPEKQQQQCADRAPTRIRTAAQHTPPCTHPPLVWPYATLYAPLGIRGIVLVVEERTLVKSYKIFINNKHVMTDSTGCFPPIQHYYYYCLSTHYAHISEHKLVLPLLLLVFLPPALQSVSTYLVVQFLVCLSL